MAVPWAALIPLVLIGSQVSSQQTPFMFNNPMAIQRIPQTLSNPAVQLNSPFSNSASQQTTLFNNPANQQSAMFNTPANQQNPLLKNPRIQQLSINPAEQTALLNNLLKNLVGAQNNNPSLNNSAVLQSLLFNKPASQGSLYSRPAVKQTSLFNNAANQQNSISSQPRGQQNPLFSNAAVQQTNLFNNPGLQQTFKFNNPTLQSPLLSNSGVQSLPTVKQTPTLQKAQDPKAKIKSQIRQLIANDQKQAEWMQLALFNMTVQMMGKLQDAMEESKKKEAINQQKYNAALREHQDNEEPEDLTTEVSEWKKQENDMYEKMWNKQFGG